MLQNPQLQQLVTYTETQVRWRGSPPGNSLKIWEEKSTCFMLYIRVCLKHTHTHTHTHTYPIIRVSLQLKQENLKKIRCRKTTIEPELYFSKCIDTPASTAGSLSEGSNGNGFDRLLKWEISQFPQTLGALINPWHNSPIKLDYFR